MDPASFLLAVTCLRLDGIRIAPEGITLTMTPTEDFSHCPACGQRSTRIHSHYYRRLQDLPAGGRVVRLDLQLRRFFCDFPDCPQRTFAERLPAQLTEPHARKTCRLIQALQATAFTAGGEAGARLARQLGMPASGDTLLRLIRRTIFPACDQAPRVLGVDDWAIRRGQTYGTILCDLERHRTVDLLPERSSQVFAAWLGQHRGTKIISRDRGSDYAKGATQGAPTALQVADRWHLLHNLTAALQQAIDRRQPLIGEVANEVAAALAPLPPPASAVQLPSGASPVPLTALTRAEQKKQDSRARRMARYQRVQELCQQGMPLREITRTLKIGRETVERFARCPQFPERATPAPHAMPIDAFLPHLQKRWEEGCDNVQQLFLEIRGQGFTGSKYMVRRQVRRWRRAAGSRTSHGPAPIARPRVIRPSARRIAWLALGHVRQPTTFDQTILAAMYRRWPELQETAELCCQFASLLHEHAVDSLEAWVQLAREPNILQEIGRFANVLRQDWSAVVEAVRLPWNQGQVEGQINRLKLIKRQMYGRARFDLLRQRVLHA